VVGFADLAGFTARTQELSPADLDDFVRAFEEIVLEGLTQPGTPLAKLIGDEAMFVSGTADDGAHPNRRPTSQFLGIACVAGAPAAIPSSPSQAARADLRSVQF
jgi:class 3 adenylate cyclase